MNYDYGGRQHTYAPVEKPSEHRFDKEDRPRIVAELCNIIIGTDAGLNRILNSNPAYPSYTTLLKWLNEDIELFKRYSHAREQQQLYCADKVIEVAWEVPDSQQSRLIIDAMKWRASHLNRKNFGDHKTLEHSGPDGAPLGPLTIVSVPEGYYVRPPEGGAETESD